MKLYHLTFMKQIANDIDNDIKNLELEIDELTPKVSGFMYRILRPRDYRKSLNENIEKFVRLLNQIKVHTKFEMLEEIEIDQELKSSLFYIHGYNKDFKDDMKPSTYKQYSLDISPHLQNLKTRLSSYVVSQVTKLRELDHSTSPAPTPIEVAMERDAFVYVQQLYNDIKNTLSNVKLEAPQPSESSQTTASVQDEPVVFKNYWQLLGEDIEALDAILRKTKTLPVLGNTELQLSPDHIKGNIITTLTELQTQLFVFDWDNEHSKGDFDAIMRLSEKLGSQLFPSQPKAPKPRRKTPVRRAAPIRRAKRGRDDADTDEEHVSWTLNPAEVYMEMKLVKKDGDS
ncbi:hypothetical protein LTR84_005594 [Exophiala bonariae]|uniref:Prion-inhibition and propagation HeLo domain-containing protein n=1 Tax=Exophiala bonariae TaxID=1690606 RepID=A0AAV9N3Z9_9EURO|nr:hypothetical protein LTR84_005594 [Exophiala bonariae]